MEIQLTKDSDKFICLIYKEYLSRRKNNISRKQAIRFETEYINEFIMKHGYNPDDIIMIRLELAKQGLITNWIATGFYINDNGIIYMENRFKNGLIEVADFLSKFIP